MVVIVRSLRAGAFIDALQDGAPCLPSEVDRRGAGFLWCLAASSGAGITEADDGVLRRHSRG